MSLGQNIRLHREKLGMSQEELATRLGYKDRSTIAKIESNVNDITQSKILAIAQVLETTPATLMGWDEQPQVAPELSKEDSQIMALVKRLTIEQKRLLLAQLIVLSGSQQADPADHP